MKINVRHSYLSIQKHSSFLYRRIAMLHSGISLTTRQRRIKDSLCGSIRPGAKSTARRVDTHTAGMRSQALL